MPDWTYQTLFRPSLRLLPYSLAQSIAFRAMGILGRNPIGRTVIRFMGHAAPPNSVALTTDSLSLSSPVALGCGVDIEGRATSALSLFGFGLIEVGPVVCRRGAEDEVSASKQPAWSAKGLTIPAGHTVDAVTLRSSLQKNVHRGQAAVFLQLQVHDDDDDVVELARSFVDLVDGFTLQPCFDDEEKTVAVVTTLIKELQPLKQAILITLPASISKDVVKAIGKQMIAGVILRFETQGAAEASVLADRKRLLPGQLLMAHGGVHEPVDALRWLAAGADGVMIDSGLAEAGPGLPKRINGTICDVRESVPDAHNSDSVPVAHRSWFWALLLGLSLVVGGLLAISVGWTRVVLPYDEEFLGMLRDEICSINPQLLPFMSHDRVTLAGTMLGLGPLYLALAWFGDRRGQHWARVAVLSSSFVGFLSFFLFLGFGYFDPFHAFISAILFQLMTAGLRSSQAAPWRRVPDLRNSSSWRRAMWGQLLMVAQGGAILLAGMVISSFGVTSVFVAEDFAFMQTTREALVAANARLIPLVAHDRASFGGMLMATGVTVLLSSLWGWHRGRRWLWWALFGSGTVAYLTTIVVHWQVGYTSLKHLLPAYGGLLVLWLAMLLSREWMSETESDVIVF